MHANTLISALKTSHTNGLFKQMVFYLEACESGSMFEGLLPKDLPIYAVTAANAKESSWGTYCPPLDVVNGKHMRSCLGDLFSVNWMQDSEGTLSAKPLTAPSGRVLLGGHPTPAPTPYPPAPPAGGMNETLEVQFERVRAFTNKSHVMEFGQIDWAKNEKISDFQAAAGFFLGLRAPANTVASEEEKLKSAVPSRDIPRYLAELRYQETQSVEDEQKFLQEKRVQDEMQKQQDALLKYMPEKSRNALLSAPLDSIEPYATCHQQATEEFGVQCGWTDKNLQLSATLYRLCEFTQGEIAAVKTAVQSACSA
jgi:legumain